MLIYFVVLVILQTSWAGRAAYLGGDIDQYAAISKKSHLYPKSNRPITSKQLENYRKYQSKFSDIAKAYAEGYKAAIQAVQARAVIAQRRLKTLKKKSKIPDAAEAFIAKTNNNVYAEKLNLEDFRNAEPNFVTVPGSERSSFPNPSDFMSHISKRSVDEQEKSNAFHRGVPSIALSDEKRAEISRLNAAALHRNFYMDNLGGVSYGGVGGVLSRQGWRYKQKHRRSSEENNNEIEEPVFVIRHRRSRTPYLGQNLDRLGVVRVQPNWIANADKKGKVPVPKINTPQTAPQRSPKKSARPAPLNKRVNPFMRHTIPQMPWQQRQNFPVNPYYQEQMVYPNPYGPFMFPATEKIESNNDAQQKKVSA